jgi:predicted ferric reductase
MESKKDNKIWIGAGVGVGVLLAALGIYYYTKKGGKGGQKK